MTEQMQPAQPNVKKARFEGYDIVCCFGSLIFAFVFNLVSYISLNKWIQSIEANGLMFLSIMDFVLYFALDFATFGIALFMVRKQYRIIGAILLLYLEFIFLIDNLNYSNYILFLNSIVQFSAGATGAILAIYLHLREGKKASVKEENALCDLDVKPFLEQQAKNLDKKSPALPKFLLTLSLLSVPTSYLVLIISSFIVVGWCVWGLVLVLQLPQIPVFIILGLGVAPFIAIVAAFKSLAAVYNAQPGFEPAVILSQWKRFKIGEVVEEVCKKIDTKLPDNILLHAQPTFFVTNAKQKTFDGVVKGRTLAIGVPLFKELSLQELKAVLAHEFSHFSGNDTLYSIFVWPVYKSLGTAVDELGDFGKGDNSNVTNLTRLLLILPNLFVALFLRYFSTIDRILSRTRELRADWYAAKIYGSNAITSALLKVHEVSAHFSESAYGVALNSNEDFFETYSANLKTETLALQKYRRASLAEENEDYDTHPALGLRIVEMPYVISDEPDMSANYLLADMHDEEKKLAKFYTERMRSLKEHYDEIEKANANARYTVQINGAQQLRKNQQFLKEVAEFGGTDASSIDQLCAKNTYITVNDLSEERALQLIAIIKRYTTDFNARQTA